MKELVEQIESVLIGRIEFCQLELEGIQSCFNEEEKNSVLSLVRKMVKEIEEVELPWLRHHNCGEELEKIVKIYKESYNL